MLVLNLTTLGATNVFKKACIYRLISTGQQNFRGFGQWKWIQQWQFNTNELFLEATKPGQSKHSSRLKSGDYNEVDIEWLIVKRIWLMTDQIDSLDWKEFERIRGIGHFLTSAVMTTWFLSSDKTWSRAFQASASISLMTPQWRFQDDKKTQNKTQNRLSLKIERFFMWTGPRCKNCSVSTAVVW